MEADVLQPLERLAGAARVSASVARNDTVIAEITPDNLLSTASMGKVFLLLAIGRAINAGTIDGDAFLTLPSPEERVADSGLWQFMSSPLTVGDCALLVAAVSDNLATNVLLDLVGLEAVRAESERAGYATTAMLDRIRDVRTPDHPPAPSVGTAHDYRTIIDSVFVADDGTPEAFVRDLLMSGTDHSMVASGAMLDPLVRESGAGGSFINKTGTDLTVRADAGVMGRPEARISYAVLVNWDADQGGMDSVVMAAMREVGQRLLTPGRAP